MGILVQYAKKAGKMHVFEHSLVAINDGVLGFLLNVVGIILPLVPQVVGDAGDQEEEELLAVDVLLHFCREREGLVCHLR